MTYSEKLKDPRWQKMRLYVLERDQWRCKLCGDHKITLHVHHLKYFKNPWDADPETLVTLCEHCHAITEWNKKQNAIFKPFTIQKHDLTTGGIQLIALYVNGDNDPCIDIFHWTGGDLSYKSTVPHWVMHRIDHFFNTMVD